MNVGLESAGTVVFLIYVLTQQPKYQLPNEHKFTKYTHVPIEIHT